jgi:hypothetical protein
MDDNRVFEIPAPNLSKFQDKWEKLVRRANKLGVTPPIYTITGEEPRSHKAKRERFNDSTSKMEWVTEDVVMIYHLIQIDHPKVKVPGGWEFVATLEHTEEGNITHNISGIDLPNEYRDCEPWCDHCQARRNRKDTFVVMDEQHSYKQVGRNCLAEFLGVDGTLYANMAEIYYTASELAEASGSGESWGGTGPWFDYLDKFLANVAEVIATEGWLSRKTARTREEETGNMVASTSDIAFRHMHPSPYEKTSDRLYDQPSGKSEELAKEAIAWCEGLADSEVDSNEYLHNIRIIARRGIVGARQYGYAASIVSAYQRTLVDAANKMKSAQQRESSNYVGTIKTRQEFTVMVEKVLQFDSAYGTIHMHIMSDTNGNRLTWKSSSSVLDTGKLMVIKATVKAHNEYKGTKQTELTRCSEVT